MTVILLLFVNEKKLLYKKYKNTLKKLIFFNKIKYLEIVFTLSNI